MKELFKLALNLRVQSLSFLFFPLQITHCVGTYFLLLFLSLTDLADNLAMDDLTFHELLLTPRLATDTHGGASVPGAADGLYVPNRVFFLFVILLLFGFQWTLQSLFHKLHSRTRVFINSWLSFKLASEFERTPQLNLCTYSERWARLRTEDSFSLYVCYLCFYLMNVCFFFCTSTRTCSIAKPLKTYSPRAW